VTIFKKLFFFKFIKKNEFKKVRTYNILMKVPLFKLINIGFKYVVETSKFYKIDESHGIKHSMEVYGFAKKIYESEFEKNCYLEKQREIIYMAAIGHDMCDKKYMDEKEGILRYKKYLSEFMTSDNLEIMGKIIGTMSYSKVKANGYPKLGEYQLAYNIVREADLLSAYDIDRSIMYTMHRDNSEYSVALREALNLFDSRVFTMKQERLFTTNYSKNESLKLHLKAKKDIKCLIENIYN
jgi:hypothetical protein